MGSVGKTISVSVTIILGLILGTIGVFKEDPIYLSGGVLWLASGAIYLGNRRLERKIEELHGRIDRLASKIR